MEQEKEETKGFMLFRNVYEHMNLVLRTNKQRAEFLFALCDFVFYEKEYEGKNEIIKSLIENAMPAIIKQQKNYKRNSSKYKNKDKDNNNKDNDNYKYTSDDESKKRFREREKIYSHSTRSTMSDEEKEEINAKFRNEK